jgi:hypothetical protein
MNFISLHFTGFEWIGLDLIEEGREEERARRKEDSIRKDIHK